MTGIVPITPGCWTKNATPRPWIKADLEAKLTHEWENRINPDLGGHPNYVDDNVICKVFHSLPSSIKVACNGCARIDERPML